LTNSERNADNLNDGTRHVVRMKTILASILFIAPILHAADQMANPLIDYPRFRQIAQETEPMREQRRVTEAQFAAFAAEPGTIVLDARSADKFALRHIRGAVSLPFTDFTAESLARVIPTKMTRVLIYCNNNFLGARLSLASKAAPASLNISTYIGLATYGYTNVFELGPLLDVATTKLPFEGTEVMGAK
jgi:phage shock protein E